MSGESFKHMIVICKILDFVFPYVRRRVKTFGISEGMTVVDYGCGTGRYTAQFSRLVGERGKGKGLSSRHVFHHQKPTDFLKELHRITKKTAAS